MLLEAVDCLLSATCPADQLLNLPLYDYYRIGGIDTVPVGQLDTSILKPHIVVTFALVIVTAEVKSFEVYHEVLSKALRGNNMGFSVKDVPVRDVSHGSGGFPELSGPNQAWLLRISAGLSHSSPTCL